MACSLLPLSVHTCPAFTHKDIYTNISTTASRTTKLNHDAKHASFHPACRHGFSSTTISACRRCYATVQECNIRRQCHRSNFRQRFLRFCPYRKSSILDV